MIMCLAKYLSSTPHHKTHTRAHCNAHLGLRGEPANPLIVLRGEMSPLSLCDEVGERALLAPSLLPAACPAIGSCAFSAASYATDESI